MRARTLFTGAIILFLALLSGIGANRCAAADIDAMLGQMVMVGFRGTGEEPLTPDLKHLLEDVQAGRIGGVILFEPDYTTKALRNIMSTEQVKSLTDMLQKEAAVPLFIAVDQEGGLVRRFTPGHGFPDTPSAKNLGSHDNAEETLQAARELGKHLVRAGVNLDFAPVVDLDVNNSSPAIGARERAFSGDAEQVIKHAEAFAQGLAEEGLLYCYKHFPGHGSSTGDSHLGFTDISATWDERELLPYRELLAENPPCMVMIGHLVVNRLDAEHPASLSRPVVTRLLREKLGWDGVVVTDDMQMRAIVDHYGEKEAIALAVNAGVDIILMGGNLIPDEKLGRRIYGLLRELVEEGTLSRERIAESYGRIMRLKNSLE